MRTKIIIALVAIAGMLGLAGCKPKTTTLPPTPPATPQPKITLTGQMFIVTEGAENVKLGDVEVLLIEKSQVTNFFQQKTAAVQVAMDSLQHEFVASSNLLEKLEANLNFFESNDPLNTAEYKIMLNDYNTATNECAQLNEQAAAFIEQRSKMAGDADDANAAAYAARNTPLLDEADNTAIEKEEAYKTFTQTNDPEMVKIWQKYHTFFSQALDLGPKLDKIEKNANSGKKDEMEEQVAEAQMRYNVAVTNLSNYPVAESYFVDFSVPAVQKTLTDADGKFSVTYSRDSALTIFAHAQRMVGTKTEQYYWLINAPTNAETIQIFLSNHNLITVDPDGYFKIKPVAISEESEASQPASGN
jgi:hypothetical protein